MFIPTKERVRIKRTFSLGDAHDGELLEQPGTVLFSSFLGLLFGDSFLLVFLLLLLLVSFNVFIDSVVYIVDCAHRYGSCLMLTL